MAFKALQRGQPGLTNTGHAQVGILSRPSWSALNCMGGHGITTMLDVPSTVLHTTYSSNEARMSEHQERLGGTDSPQDQDSRPPGKLRNAWLMPGKIQDLA